MNITSDKLDRRDLKGTLMVKSANNIARREKDRILALFRS
jgi:hypothetical protein